MFSVNSPVDLYLFTFVYPLSLYSNIFHFHQCFYLHLLLHFLSFLVFLYIYILLFSSSSASSSSLSLSDACNFIFTHQKLSKN